MELVLYFIIGFSMTFATQLIMQGISRMIAKDANDWLIIAYCLSSIGFGVCLSILFISHVT